MLGSFSRKCNLFYFKKILSLILKVILDKIVYYQNYKKIKIFVQNRMFGDRLELYLHVLF